LRGAGSGERFEESAEICDEVRISRELAPSAGELPVPKLRGIILRQRRKLLGFRSSAQAVIYGGLSSRH
jgi:hypothetical protein